MTEELKPCPFCGCADLKVAHAGFQAVAMVECNVCGAEGPCFVRDKDAITAWNRRAPVVTPDMTKRALNVQPFAPREPVRFWQLFRDSCDGGDHITAMEAALTAALSPDQR